MTREDMLRELELLPVWQLREPLPSRSGSALPQKIATTVLEASVEPTTLTVAESLPVNLLQVVTDDVLIEAIALPNEELPVTQQQLFTHIASDDGRCLFVLSNTALQADEAHLLQNIFIAMRVKVKSAETSVNIANVIEVNQPKMVITMGELAAQTMLQTAETLANLRGKLHQFQGATLVATYDLSHLLQHQQDKAKAWTDLCFAMQILQNLN